MTRRKQKMRTKPNDKDIAQRITEYKAGLPSDYKLVELSAPRNDIFLVGALESKLFPRGIKEEPSSRKDIISHWADDPTIIGYFLFNSNCKINSGLVAAAVLNYEEKYDRNILTDRLRGSSFSYDNLDYDHLDCETATIKLAGVMPGDPNSVMIMNLLMHLAVVSSKDACFYDMVYPLWENDPMLPVAKDFGFVEIGKEVDKMRSGEKKVVLKKELISPADYFRSLAYLTGGDWFNDYLQGTTGRPRK
jgi:hypothetical protein